MTTLQRIAGCWHGGGKVYNHHGTFNMSRPLDVLRYRAWRQLDSAREWPRDVRWRLANRLSWIAMRLRGDKQLEGFHCLQNRAAELEDRITWKFLTSPVTLDEDECEEIRDAAHRLATIARATGYVDYWIQSR